MKPLSYVLALFFTLICTQCNATLLLINELHYDNTGSDKNEFVEVIADAGTDLSQWSLLFYNGSNGLVYKSTALHGIVPDSHHGIGFRSFSVSGIQNGSPDGIALVNTITDAVADFISYEGSFTAQNGTATGFTSTDIVVNQPPSAELGFSLQRTDTLAKNTWHLATHTPGTINEQQTLVASPVAVNLPNSMTLFLLGLLLIVVQVNGHHSQTKPKFA